MQLLRKVHFGEIFMAERSLNQSGLFALKRPLMLRLQCTNTIAWVFLLVMRSRIPNGNICSARNAAAMSRQNEWSEIASHASPGCLWQITPRLHSCCWWTPREGGLFCWKWKSFLGPFHVSHRMRLPGFCFWRDNSHTWRHLRIPGLLINGIRPVLASFALRSKQPEFSGLRLQKKAQQRRPLWGEQRNGSQLTWCTEKERKNS